MSKNQKNNEIKELLSGAKNYLNNNDMKNAAVTYSNVLKLDPTNLAALEQLGIIMANTGNNEMAEKIFRQIINFFPQNANAYNNLSNVLDSLSKQDDALEALKTSLKLEPDNLSFLQNYARILTLKNNFEEAYKIYKKIHELDKNNAGVLKNLADMSIAFHPLDYTGHLEKLYELSPTPTVRMSLETSIPMHFESQAEIDNFRSGFSKKLEKFSAENNGKIAVNEKILQDFFYLAYHNRNNKKIKTELAELYKNKVEDISWVAPHCINYKFDASQKIKVGFISGFFHKHPVSQCFTGLITELSKDDKFDVSAFYCGVHAANKKNHDDEYVNKLKQNKINICLLPENVKQTREYIASQKLDALIYLDIGMYWLSYNLAFSRLAPIQAVLPGHPDTTGIDTMDYYLSTKDFESENGQDFYSEKLETFDSICTYIEKPVMPETLKTREELGLPLDKKIYYCPMKNHKMHPDFDLVIKAILENDADAIFMLPKDVGKISEITSARIEKNIGASLAKRIFYHEWASNQEFISYLKTADVVLDTFYFGAGTTVYYTLMAEVPMVTLPGNTSGGRVLNAAYKKIGMNELIAKDKDDFLKIVFRIANDPDYKKTVCEKIKQKKDILFCNNGFVDELKTFLKKQLISLADQ